MKEQAQAKTGKEAQADPEPSKQEVDKWCLHESLVFLHAACRQDPEGVNRKNYSNIDFKDELLIDERRNGPSAWRLSPQIDLVFSSMETF